MKYRTHHAKTSLSHNINNQRVFHTVFMMPGWFPTQIFKVLVVPNWADSGLQGTVAATVPNVDRPWF